MLHFLPVLVLVFGFRGGAVHYQNKDFFVGLSHKVVFAGVLLFFVLVLHEFFVEGLIFFKFFFVVVPLLFVFVDFFVQITDDQPRGIVKENNPDQENRNRNEIFVRQIFLCPVYLLCVFLLYGFYQIFHVVLGIFQGVSYYGGQEIYRHGIGAHIRDDDVRIRFRWLYKFIMHWLQRGLVAV